MKLLVEPGLAPGGMVFQVITSTGEVLSQVAATMADWDRADDIGRDMYLLACRWTGEHPGRSCWIVSYDGETGEPSQAMEINTEDRPDDPIPEGARLVEASIPLAAPPPA